MKAVICSKYHSPPHLRIEEVPKPVPHAGELLVRVYATAVNDFDWSLVRGKPYPYRLFLGLGKPKSEIPGIEFSGIIEETGDENSNYKVGDAVYGDISRTGWGTFAEYVCVKESDVFIKPSDMSFEEAAALPHAGMLAIQGLIDEGKIKDGSRVLINGAGGGVGTLGLQLAKLYHAEVTGVDSGEKLNMMKAQGFDHVLDFKKVDFTRLGERYDLILDAKTTRSPSSYKRCLTPEGAYITVGGYVGRMLQLVILSPFYKNKMTLVNLNQNKDLPVLNELYEAGKIKPVIDGPFSFEETEKAMNYFGEGRHKGKVIITIIETKSM
jgi:NADPH:quinone reductase-like Zn-dependent oxidoreductase